MNRLIKLTLFAGFFMILAAVAGAGALLLISDGKPISYLQKSYTRLMLAGRDTELAQPAGTDDRPQRFQVSAGDTPPAVAQNLYAAGLIHDPQLYIDYVLVNDLDREMEAGVYFPNQTMTIPQIATLLTDSSKSFIPFRVLEGWRLEEIANAIDNNNLLNFSGADFLAMTGPGAQPSAEFVQWVGLPVGVSLEGFMFPDTYQLPPTITAEGLRDHLLQTFMEKTGPQMAADAAAQNLTLYQVVVLASITEREAIHNDENARVAAVYRNRMNIGMKLDADPTVQYSIGFRDGTWWPQITQADYSAVISPYNTYLSAGLPPGPIANPGLSAIQGTVYADTSDYLYFRAACDGSGYHNFARTFEEHLANGC